MTAAGSSPLGPDRRPGPRKPGSAPELVRADVDGLVLEIGVDRLGAEFAADTAVLHASERRAQVQVVVVDADRAGPDLTRHVQPALLIGAPDLPAEAVVVVVGDPDRVRVG